MDFKEILNTYKTELDLVEKAIQENFHSDVALIPDISSYLISGGGKRVRPLLVIISSKLCGHNGSSKKQIEYSVVAEYIHAATLLHDDVVDEADIRRGSESSNIKYGNQASVLVGDFLFAKSFQIMSDGADIRVVQAVSRATKNLAEGEVLQLVNTCNIEMTEQIYLDTIFRKTGALMMACCEIGAILGKAPDDKEAALAKYGRNIGIAFQLMDDVLDYVAQDDKWGKPLGADLAEGKVTLPLIHAWGKANPSEQDLVRKALDEDGKDKKYLAPTLDIIKKYGGIEYTLKLAREYIDSAKDNLAGFDDSPHLDALLSTADYIIERKI